MQSQIVTGGTGGLGLLTARWLAQHSAQLVTIASRSGALMADMAADMDAEAGNVAPDMPPEGDMGPPPGDMAEMPPPPPDDPSSDDVV